MTGRERITRAAEKLGYAVRPDPNAPWALAGRILRYTRGSRRVTVYYSQTGVVLEASTARQGVGRTTSDKAGWVLDYLNGGSR